MSSQRVGVVRGSMLTNPLLIKPDLGQSRSRGLSLPSPDFTSGTSKSLMGDGGVAEVLSSWRIQSRLKEPAPRRPAVPDFVSLNRDAVKSGLVTSKGLSQYQAQGGRARTKCPGGAPRCPPLSDLTFGITTRASSPLSDLLSHQYGQRWLDQQLSRNHTNNNNKHRMKPAAPQHTRTSLLRMSKALPVKQTLSRLTHFTQVPPALDSGTRKLQSLSRKGHQGLGSYNLDRPEDALSRGDTSN